MCWAVSRYGKRQSVDTEVIQRGEILKHNCNHFKPVLSRRDLLAQSAGGLRMLALAALLGEQAQQRGMRTRSHPKRDVSRAGERLSSSSCTAGRPRWISSNPSRS